MLNWLTSYEFLGLLALLMLGLTIFRVWKNPSMMALDRELVTDWISSPAANASPGFQQAFYHMEIPEGEDVHLLRVAFVNRGRLAIGEQDFAGQVSIVLPEGVDITAATADGAPDVQPEIWRNRVTQPPFALPAGERLTVNLILRGKAEPKRVTGALKGQTGLRRVRLKFRT